MADSTRIVKLGLGEAIQRLVQVEELYRRGITLLPQQALDERQMLLAALNQVELNLNFDCDDDGVPDTVEIFVKAAETSCCRLLKPEPQRKVDPKNSRRR
jgi:hypothetical protein